MAETRNAGKVDAGLPTTEESAARAEIRRFATAGDRLVSPKHIAGGNDVVVVVSAMGGTTDGTLDLAQRVQPRHRRPAKMDCCSPRV